MNTVLVLAAALVAAAPGEAPVAAQKPNVEANVRAALQRSALVNFAGTISFERDTWDPASGFSPDTPESIRRRQHWTITTDGRGNLRGSISWSSGVAVHFGRIDGHRWILMTGDMLIQHEDARPADVAQDNRLMLMDNFIQSAEGYLARILDPVAANDSLNVLVIDRDPERPSAVIQVDDDVKRIDFTPIGDVLVPRTMVRSDELSTYRFDYSGFRPVDGRWVPTQIDFRRLGEVQPASHVQAARLSDIQAAVVADPESADLTTRLQIPQADDPDAPLIVAVLTYTAAGIKAEGAR